MGTVSDTVNGPRTLRERINMNRNRLVGAVAIAAAITAAASTASATLTSSDWQNDGDGLLTIDSDTGLQWLDWSHTVNRSYNDVSSQLGDGGEFEGFRYATEAEMRTLYANAGAVFIAPIDGEDAGNIPALLLLNELFGRTYTNGGEAIYGLEGNQNEEASTLGDWPNSGASHHMVSAYNEISGQIAIRWLNMNDESTADFLGHALVMVPAPGTIVLGALGGLVAFRRRR
jgi:hypothetical protein